MCERNRILDIRSVCEGGEVACEEEEGTGRRGVASAASIISVEGIVRVELATTVLPAGAAALTVHLSRGA